MDYGKIIEGLLIGAGAGATSALLIGLIALVGKYLKRRSQLRHIASLVDYFMFFLNPNDEDNEYEGAEEVPEHIRKDGHYVTRLIILEMFANKLDLLLRHQATNLAGNDLAQIYDALLFVQRHLDQDPERYTRRVHPGIIPGLYEMFRKIEVLKLPSEPPWERAEVQKASTIVRFLQAVRMRWHFIVNWIAGYYPR